MYKIVVVEDEMIIRKGLVYSFDFASCNSKVVSDVENGRQALDYIKDNKVDIVITDISMPIMDGLELAKNLMGTSIKVILISGFSDFDYARRAIKYGVSEYLVKPLNYDDLRTSILECEKQVDEARYLEEMKKIDLTTSQVFKDIKSDDELFNDILDYIKKNYQAKLSLEDIANEFSYSVSTIKTKFKDNGTTFNNELNKYRIFKALELYKEGSKPIYEIATMVGFSDYKYFSTVFKKYTGSSVKEIIKEN